MQNRFLTDYHDELRKLFNNREGILTIADILRRLIMSAREKTFREALRDWANDYEERGLTEAINILPYGQPGSCRELLMVFSLGRTQFDTRLREAIDHCAIICPGKTTGVLFVTDFWDNEKFWDTSAPSFNKLSDKYGVVLAITIWNGKSFTLEQIVP